MIAGRLRDARSRAASRALRTDVLGIPAGYVNDYYRWGPTPRTSWAACSSSRAPSTASCPPSAWGSGGWSRWGPRRGPPPRCASPSPGSPLAFATAGFAVAALTGLLASWECLVLVGVNAAVMGAYESRLKARGAVGNLAIGYLVGSLFLFAGLAVYAGRGDPLLRAALP